MKALKKFIKSLTAPAPPCPRDLEVSRHLQRFQCQPWYIKLWRYRWYIPIPFKATFWWLKNKFSGREQERFYFFWSIAIGLAQSPMEWYHTMDEVFGKYRNLKQTDEDENGIEIE